VKKLAQKRILKKIVKSLSPVEDLKAIILYGSFARGDFGPKSDIDLFFLTAKPGTRLKIQDSIIGLELERDIQPTIRTLDELKKTDTGLLQNVFQEGKIIFLREAMDIDVRLLLKQKPYILYTFSLDNLDQKRKAKFNRELYSRKSEKYSYSGLLQDLGGRKLASGCIMVSLDKKREVEKFFKKYKISPEAINIWK